MDRRHGFLVIALFAAVMARADAMSVIRQVDTFPAVRARLRAHDIGRSQTAKSVTRERSRPASALDGRLVGMGANPVNAARQSTLIFP